MTPYEYVLRAWEPEIVPDLERKYGWTAYTAWQVHQAVKAKQPLPEIYETDPEFLEKEAVSRMAVRYEQKYLAALKRVEGLK